MNMTREIKFRVWNKYIKIMTYTGKDFYISFGESSWPPFPNNEWVGYGYNQNSDCFSSCAYSSDNGYEIMQFTGLHDKNGKEIYEGDICRWQTRVDDEHFNVFRVSGVVYQDGAFIVKYQDSEDGELIKDCYIEVIGNIYENPELLADQINNLDKE